MRQVDFIVVGGGLAGLSIAYKLMLHNQSVCIMHQSKLGEASTVSAGLMNPITGMRYVKSWNWDLLQLHFIKFYREIESAFAIQLLSSKRIVQEINNVESLNQISSRVLDPSYSNYINITRDKDIESVHINATMLNVELYLETLKEFFIEKKSILDISFDYDKLRQPDQCYDDIVYSKGIVFCEGSFAIDNPYFNYIPFMAVKGHRSIIHTNEVKLIDIILKKDYNMIPLDHGKYWIGSNYEFNNRDTDINRVELLEQERFIKTQFDPKLLMDSKCEIGIRPAVRDRRPVVGAHPQLNKLFILNGLGTKGSSLAPYCADQLVKYLLNDQKLDKDIDVKRFAQVYAS